MIQPLAYKDFYKTDHRRQYPPKTEMIYSNFTPRASRLEGANHVVVFGIQYFIKEYLIKRFNEEFFNRPKDLVVKRYKRRLDTALGLDAVPVDHIAALHDLGYLPIKIKALPEGTLCPLRVPCLTIRNTVPEFYWMTNFLETLLSTCLWMPMTSATIANQYRQLLDKYATKTSDIPEFVDWQGHDFSMRGHTSIESGSMSGAGHLLSFTGTDTIAAIDFLEEYYGADADKELIGGSVPATEHSVMSMGGMYDEVYTYRRLLTEIYPKGIVSVVSDTWDYWKVLTELLPKIKDVIMGRDGKLVIRPDSGDPVKIICGDPEAEPGSNAYKGSAKILWEQFGGKVNSKGYRQLDSHIGLIYGDSITIDRCRRICEGLARSGFASTNTVFGIGSYTYQHVTRDTFGFAVKSTFGVIDGKDIPIFKDPKTDDGEKKSAKGLLRVNADLSLSEEVSWEEEGQGLLQTVFENGDGLNFQSLSQIRKRLKENAHG